MNAQSLFQSVSETQAGLSPSEVQKLSQITTELQTESAQLVSISDFEVAIQDGILDFQLPGISKMLSAEADIMEWNTADDFTWSGQLIGANGYAIFQKTPGDDLSGFFEVEGAKFELRSFNQNYQALIKKDETPTT